MTSVVDKAAMETEIVLAYLHEGDTSSSNGYDTDEKTGLGLNASIDYVKPLSRTLSYAGGVSLSYKTFNKGEKVEESGNTTTTTKLSRDDTTSISLSLLGIRLNI